MPRTENNVTRNLFQHIRINVEKVIPHQHGFAELSRNNIVNSFQMREKNTALSFFGEPDTTLFAIADIPCFIEANMKIAGGKKRCNFRQISFDKIQSFRLRRAEHMIVSAKSASNTTSEFCAGLIFRLFQKKVGMSENGNDWNGFNPVFLCISDNIPDFVRRIGLIFRERMKTFRADSTFQVKHQIVVTALMEKINRTFDKYHCLRLPRQIHLDGSDF